LADEVGERGRGVSWSGGELDEEVAGICDQPSGLAQQTQRVPLPTSNAPPKFNPGTHRSARERVAGQHHLPYLPQGSDPVHLPPVRQPVAPSAQQRERGQPRHAGERAEAAVVDVKLTESGEWGEKFRVQGPMTGLEDIADGLGWVS